MNSVGNASPTRTDCHVKTIAKTAAKVWVVPKIYNSYEKLVVRIVRNFLPRFEVEVAWAVNKLLKSLQYVFMVESSMQCTEWTLTGCAV